MIENFGRMFCTYSNLPSSYRIDNQSLAMIQNFGRMSCTYSNYPSSYRIDNQSLAMIQNFGHIFGIHGKAIQPPK